MVSSKRASLFPMEASATGGIAAFQIFATDSSRFATFASAGPKGLSPFSSVRELKDGQSAEFLATDINALGHNGIMLDLRTQVKDYPNG